MTMDPQLSPLEKALVDTLQSMHHDVIKELRIFRWQTVMLVIFLIGVVSLLKGVDPRIAAAPIKDLLPTDHAAEVFAHPPAAPALVPAVEVPVVTEPVPLVP